MRKIRGPGAVLLAMLSILLMVFGVAAPASATTVTYWNGSTIQNQTKASGTSTMSGGSVAVTPAALLEARATVIGIGSFSSVGSVSYSHSSSYTYVYCQWRFAYSEPGSHPLTCKWHN